MMPPPMKYCLSASFHRFQNTSASTIAEAVNRMASSQKVGSTSTLLFITTNELPQMTVARMMRGVASRVSTRSLFCSCCRSLFCSCTVAPLL